MDQAHERGLWCRHSRGITSQPNSFEHRSWLAGEGGCFIMSVAKSSSWTSGAGAVKPANTNIRDSTPPGTRGTTSAESLSHLWNRIEATNASFLSPGSGSLNGRIVPV